MYTFAVECVGALTLVVLILFPEEHIHPELSGRVLHSSPSRHGSISHHHFPITMDAAEGEDRSTTRKVSLLQRHVVTCLPMQAHSVRILHSTLTIHLLQYEHLQKKTPIHISKCVFSPLLFSPQRSCNLTARALLVMTIIS